MKIVAFNEIYEFAVELLAACSGAEVPLRHGCGQVVRTPHRATVFRTLYICSAQPSIAWLTVMVSAVEVA
jgi:hypothetical protein